ncbi:cytokine receptor-like factor 3 [Mercenaria mercenaria]|uniref:cytokine receptor-like factor 3 n=1 Tax=Mercenaria mercenaria TaxID=6596 RepID=UPI00234F4A27|nr:cytokine receptor-like factor 3 [Mercenaria mercenaria]XP_053393116.1 cytokine receptor-like factor 3 [Mercenaria mercenaria]
MSDTDELIQNVIDTVDNACTQKHGLTEQLQSLTQAKQQIQHSSKIATDHVKNHFENLKKALNKSLEARMSEMLAEIEALEKSNLEPLHQCEDMINLSLVDAASCIEEGKGILENGPENNVDALLKFKDAPHSKDLHVLPEVPCLSEVAFISVDFNDGLSERFHDLIEEEGRIYDRAPVQIIDVEERPGALLVKWEEVDEDTEANEFRLQYCNGQTTAWDAEKCTFHSVYTGPNTSYLVRRLRTNKQYSFRVSCRIEDHWSIWGIPRVAKTLITHYQWDDNTEGYSTSNENKTGTRSHGLTRVLYSKSQCYRAGFPISFRILDSGEKSPLDGLGIAVTNDDIDTMKREGAVFLACNGTVFIDGQEMKTRLPCLSRNSSISIETETLPNGKVRVSVQVEDKELTFDWNIDKQVTLGMIGGLGMTPLTESTQCFFFGMIFSHEDWKVTVE